MKIKYTANDGTSFDSKDECIAYENENAMSEYEKEWGECISLKERAHKVRKLWNNQSTRALTDNYLALLNETTRSDSPTYIAGELDYGIVYMRDDAVEILLKYIEELECDSDDRK